MKRTLMIMSLLVIASLLLVACGKQAEPEPAPPVEQPPVAEQPPAEEAPPTEEAPEEDGGAVADGQDLAPAPAETEGCSDSDGGNAPEVYGETTYNFGKSVKQDVCSKNLAKRERNVLLEYTCDPDTERYVLNEIECANACQDGACV